MSTRPPNSHLGGYVPSLLRPVVFLARTLRAEFDSRLCYYTYNYVQPDARPCYPPSAKTISHCCGIGSTCLGDTLCLSSDGPMYIGSCTVKDWFNSTTIPSDCPKYYEYCKGMCRRLSPYSHNCLTLDAFQDAHSMILTTSARQYWR